jgi:OmcA/MtrC family decaheme c-type cytochrome
MTAFMLNGCGGDSSNGATGATGATGLNGVTGPTGLQGIAGPIDLTNESCKVCHAPGKDADVAVEHAFTIDTATNIRNKPRLNEKNLAISNISVSATATGAPQVMFTVKNGTAVYSTLAFADVRFYIADMVPANTVTTKGTFGSPYWETWAYESGTAAALNTSASAAGVYIYTFPNAFGTASATNANASDYNAADIQRLYIRASSTTPGVGGAAGILDFNVPAASTTAVAVPTQNQYVTIESCRKCHGPQMNGAAHASSYVDTLACVMCHSPLSATGASAVYLPKFIHQIHAAIPAPEFDGASGNGRYNNKTAGYEIVTYPQPISNCVVCHTATAAQKTAMGSGDKIDNWKNNPTGEICQSCHIGVNANTGVGHAVGARTNATCTGCHDIAAKHSPAPAAKNVPEFSATIVITPPAAGTFYVAGEAPTVTVTLTDKATGAAVDGSLYTAAKHASGTAVAGSLSKAALYVYGPRADAKPVLTKGAITLSATGVATQSNSLLLPATDAQVTTSATGFSYKLSAIPAGMTSGTYMVRFIAANYGYKSDTDYKIDSTAFTTIQVGTATAEKKISGDSCVDCHGTGTLGAHDARHSVVFSTDECISCHDKSGNHADPLDNRVHAIHAASKTGDKLGIDWSTVTYPQGRPGVTTAGALTTTAGIRCITCHSSGNAAYKSSVSANSCVGCHNGKTGALDHFLQNGGR